MMANENLLIENAMRRLDLAGTGELNGKWLSVICARVVFSGRVSLESFLEIVNASEFCYRGFDRYLEGVTPNLSDQKTTEQAYYISGFSDGLRLELVRRTDKLLKLVFLTRLLPHGFKLIRLKEGLAPVFGLLAETNKHWRKSGKHDAPILAMESEAQLIFNGLIEEIETTRADEAAISQSDFLQTLVRAFQAINERIPINHWALIERISYHCDAILAVFPGAFAQAAGGEKSKRTPDDGFQILAKVIQENHPGKQPSWIQKNILERMNFGKTPEGMKVTVSNGKISIFWKGTVKTVSIKYFLYEMGLFD